MVFFMTGTLINVLAILAGSSLGLLLRRRFPYEWQTLFLMWVGLFTLAFGVKLFLGGEQVLPLLAAFLSGALTGTWLDLTGKLKALGDRIRERLPASLGDDRGSFEEGFVTASVLFTVGPLTLLGALQDGAAGDFSLLSVKSVLDGVSATFLAAALGWGVAASAVFVLVVQGGLAAVAMASSPWLTAGLAADLSGVGGLLVLAIGVQILNLAPVKPADYLPALFWVPLWRWVFAVLAISG